MLKKLSWDGIHSEAEDEVCRGYGEVVMYLLSDPRDKRPRFQTHLNLPVQIRIVWITMDTVLRIFAYLYPQRNTM